MIKIDKVMHRKLNRKDFIKLVGVGLLVLMFVPSLIGNYFKEEKGLTAKGNKIYLNNKVIMEIENG